MKVPKIEVFIRNYLENLGIKILEFKTTGLAKSDLFSFECPNCGCVRELNSYNVKRGIEGKSNTKRFLNNKHILKQLYTSKEDFLCPDCSQNKRMQEKEIQIKDWCKRNNTIFLRHYTKTPDGKQGRHFSREIYVVKCKNDDNEIHARLEDFIKNKRSPLCRECVNKGSVYKFKQSEIKKYLREYKIKMGIPENYHIHHIFQVNKYPEYAFNEENFIPLTPYEHYLVHKDNGVMKKYDTNKYKSMTSLLGENKNKILELLSILAKPGLRLTKQNKDERFKDITSYIQNMMK